MTQTRYPYPSIKENKIIEPNGLFKKGVYGVDRILTFIKPTSVEGQNFSGYLNIRNESKIVINDRSSPKVNTFRKMKVKKKRHKESANIQQIQKNSKLLEEMIKSMLTDPNSVNISLSKKKFNNKDIIKATYQGKTYNLKKLLKTVDFNQIKFNEKDQENYVKQCLTNDTFFHHSTNAFNASEDFNVSKDNINKLFSKRIDNYFANKNDTEKKEKYKKLHLAEKMAIDIYTGSSYDNANKLLRGIDFIDNIQEKEARPNYIKELLLHASMSIATINKHAEQINYTIRADYNFDINVLEKKKKGNFQEKGLISTAFANSKYIDSERIKEDGKTSLTLFSNVFGMNIAPLSARATESEFLLPPSHVNYELKYTKGNIHVFEASQLQSNNYSSNINEIPNITLEEKYPIMPPLPPLPTQNNEKMPPLPPLPGNTKYMISRLKAAPVKQNMNQPEITNQKQQFSNRPNISMHRERKNISQVESSKLESVVEKPQIKTPGRRM